jgi:hypothetical protein
MTHRALFSLFQTWLTSGGGSVAKVIDLIRRHRRLDSLGAQGITEVAFQPAGDIRRELTAFARAVGLERKS